MMKIYAVKFYYDDGWSKTEEVCFLIANDVKDAKEKFKSNIYEVFNHHEDYCDIITVLQVPDFTDLIYSKSGATWIISDGEKVTF